MRNYIVLLVLAGCGGASEGSIAARGDGGVRIAEKPDATAAPIDFQMRLRTQSLDAGLPETAVALADANSDSDAPSCEALIGFTCQAPAVCTLQKSNSGYTAACAVPFTVAYPYTINAAYYDSGANVPSSCSCRVSESAMTAACADGGAPVCCKPTTSDGHSTCGCWDGNVGLDICS